MNNPQRPFATDCPQDCPPTDSTEAEGDYFRLSNTNPPCADDYKTYAELGIFPDRDPCLRCGLSVFADPKGAESLYQYMMRRHRGGANLGRYVARLELTSNEGRVKQTNRPPHHTWWMFQDIERATTFRETVKELRYAQGN